MSDLLQRRLESVAAEEPITLDSVDFTFINPNLVAEQLLRPFRFFGRTEGEVRRNVEEVRILQPFMDAPTAEFLHHWGTQEPPHGDIFDEAQRRLGGEPAPLDLDISPLFVLAGALAHVPGAHKPLGYVYLHRGATHERTTLGGYQQLLAKLEAIGERPFAQTAIRRIIPQEGKHLGYYGLAAQKTWDLMTGAQRMLARAITVGTYEPVGTGKDKRQRKAEYGQLMYDLGIVDGPDPEAIAEAAWPVQQLAMRLLGGGAIKQFVSKEFKKSIEYAQQQGLIPTSDIA